MFKRLFSSLPLPPLLSQIQSLQSHYPVLLVRVGMFYELYFSQADTIGSILNITVIDKKLTRNASHSYRFTGFPVHSLQTHLKTLVENGLSVAICEQFKKHGIVERKVVRVVSPGSALEWNEASDNCYVVAIVGGAVGWTDLTHFTVKECTNVVMELERLKPREVVFTGELSVEVEEWLRRNKINYKRIDTGGMLKRAYGDEINYLTAVEQKAVAALIAFIFDTKATPSYFKLPEREVGQSMMDASTLQSLEVFRTIRQGERKGSLVWVLDRTRTTGAKRLLKRWLELPLRNVTEINDRLNIVEHFVGEPSLKDLQVLQSRMADVERLTHLINLGWNDNAERIYKIYEALKIADELIRLLGRSKCVKKIVDQIKVMRITYNELSKAFDLPFTTEQQNYRKGFDSKMDKMQSSYCELIQKQNELEDAYRTKFSCPELTLQRSGSIESSSFIEVPKNDAARLKKDSLFSSLSAKSKSRFETKEWTLLAKKITAQEHAIQEYAPQVYHKLRDLILAHQPALYTMSDGLSSLDILCGFAELARERSYTRPTVDDSSDILIRSGRHPVVEMLSESISFTPNDFDASDTNQFWIVSGPNMGGKSTFLRQTAIIILMAHIGCFVPASKTRFGVMDRIFSRVGASDDIGQGSSTFMVEMKETANILNNATPKSFVIMDEIGRGTSPSEGLAIAYACLNYAVNANKCKGIFATHYHDINKLMKNSGCWDNIVHYKTKVVEKDGATAFLFKLERGIAENSSGIKVAEIAGLPKPVIDEARIVERQLSKT